MSKTRDTGFLGNVVKVDSNGDISLMHGSTMLMQISSSGAVTTTGVISGSNALTSSYSQNSELLDNLDSTSFVFTSSYNTDSSSFSTRTTNLETASGSFSTRVTRIEGNYATTGSNVFLGAQTVCANITSTGTIIAQTLNVQQVTSSIVYSSGSNIFGCSLANTQQFTGSVTMTGSLTVTTAGTSPEFQVNSGGTIKGNALTDTHQVTGSLLITGSNALFSVGCVGIGTTSPSAPLHVLTSATGNGAIFRYTGGANNPGLFVATEESTRYVKLTASGTSVSGQLLQLGAEGTVGVLNIGVTNVGIGTTSPGTTLMVTRNGVDANWGTIAAFDSQTSAANVGGVLTFGGFKCSQTSACSIFAKIIGAKENSTTGNECGYLAFQTNNNSTYVERMRITSGGNVGIGTTTPNISAAAAGSTLLTLAATATGRNAVIELNGCRTNNSDFVGYLRFFNNTAATPLAEIYALRGSSDISGSLAFATSGTEVMRISGSGDVKFVVPSGATKNFYFGTSTNDYGKITYNDVSGDLSMGSIGNYNILFLTNNTERARIDNCGNISIGGFSTSGTPGADYRSVEVGRQGNTLTGSPFKSSLYLSSNATITAGSSTFTYRNSSVPATVLSLEGGELTFYNAGSGTAGNNITFLERMRIMAAGAIFNKQWYGSSLSGGYTLIGTISPGNTGDRYLHVKFNTIGSMMYWIKVLGYSYVYGVIEGLGGGYIGGGTGSVNQGAQSGSIVAQYQNNGFLEVVVDTIGTGTSNRWGSITFFGGTDTITTIQALEFVAYSWTSTTTRVY